MRGSCPCSGEEIHRFGGATACVAVAADAGGAPPLVLDLGTGSRRLGEELVAAFPEPAPIALSVFVTHLHFDHIQGLPFFAPALREGAEIDVHGPADDGAALADAFAAFIRPPFFPIPLSELPARIRFHELADDELDAGAMRVRSRRIPHLGETCGYRVESAGASLAYLSDHQAPAARDSVHPAVLDLAGGVDLLVHDAQYTDAEFARKARWGHSTIAYAVKVAADAGARRLALFHHDPTHEDAALERLGDEARRLGEAAGLEEVVVAAEGLVLDVGPPAGARA